MIAVLAAVAAATGIHLVYSEVALGRRRFRTAPVRHRGAPRDRWRRARDSVAGSGGDGVRTSEFLAVMAALFVVGAAFAFAVFGGILPALAVGVFAASFPIASARARRTSKLAAAQDNWPRMIEEIRLQSSALGRSIPQALFEVGGRAPAELRDAFVAGQREWLLSTDFDRTVRVLKARLADPTADATLETLLIAHDLGGADLERRLSALVEDRILDAQGRKDARAKQAGVRFARRFVLLVPIGMALAGISVGNGRDAYRTPAGQFLVLAGIGMVAVCWWWAAQLMRLPEEQRVFSE